MEADIPQRGHDLRDRKLPLFELLTLAGRAGLELEELCEPGFGDTQREIFRAAGKEALFEEVRGLPAVLAARWRRPCS